MSINYAYASARKNYREAREEYFRLESEIAVALAKMTRAERKCSIEWRKVLDPRPVTLMTDFDAQKER